YLGGSAHRMQANVFDDDGTPRQFFQAASDAAFIEAAANIELTTCYRGTGSCLDNNEGDAGGTVVRSHLELIQLNSALGVCRVSQETAASAVTGAGYSVSNVTYQLSAARAGSVIGQDPAAGIIELPGSAVSYTVSTGGAIVPNVLSIPQSSATSIISSLGL